MQQMIVRHFEPAAYRRYEDAGSWRRASSVSSCARIRPFTASRWLTGSSSSMKSKGWHRARTKATRCCCPKGEASHGCRTLVGHAGRGKQLLDTRFALEMCQIVLQGDILLDRELLEESQVLKQHAQRAAPHVVPLRARGCGCCARQRARRPHSRSACRKENCTARSCRLRIPPPPNRTFPGGTQRRAARRRNASRRADRRQRPPASPPFNSIVSILSKIGSGPPAGPAALRIVIRYPLRPAKPLPSCRLPSSRWSPAHCVRDPCMRTTISPRSSAPQACMSAKSDSTSISGCICGEIAA